MTGGITPTRDYPDTVEGARALLHDLRQFPDCYGAGAAVIIADPWIKGAFLATWPDGHKTLCYTSGHFFGPDFEECD